MKKKIIINDIRLRLQSPTVALERIVQGRFLPDIFADAVLEELVRVYKLLNHLERKKYRKKRLSCCARPLL